MMVLHALALAQKGLAVFPCMVRGKQPATSRGCKDATKDGALIRAWWASNPNFNIGVACGPASGVFVVDVDDAEHELAELERQHGELPVTVESVTPNGRHLFFKHPQQREIRNSVSKIAPGIDVRGAGGFVVAPPSLHPSGRAYAWSVDSASAFAEAPPWLLELVVTAGNGKATPPAEWRALVADGVVEGARNQAVARLAGHLLRHGIDPHVTHELLQSWNVTHCRPPLSAEEITATADSIAAREMRRRGAA